MPEFKKALSFFLLLFISISAAKAQYESMRNPLSAQDKQMAARYKLKSMKMWITGENGDSLIQYIAYNHESQLINTLSDGVYYCYKYDKKGNTTGVTDSFRDAEKGIINRDTFQFDYDVNGYLFSAKFNANHSVFIFDPVSNTLVEHKTDTAWPELILNTYTYDTHKNLVELHVQDPATNSVTSEKITYSKDHKMLTDTIVIQLQTEDIDTISTNYTYDSKGNRAMEESNSVSYNSSGRSSRTVKRQDFYDSESRLIEEFVFENGIEKERFVFSYTGTGFEPVSEHFFSKGYLQRVDTYTLNPKTGLPETLVEEENGKSVKYRYAFELY